MKKIEFPTNQIPEYIFDIASELIKNKYKAFLVGGAVRDLILERHVRDYDIATDATPEQVNRIFPKCIATGAKFGNTIVVATNRFKESFSIDVTTFRQEENYYGGRWPTKVEYTSSIKKDLSRRDFTINALALDLEKIIMDADKYIPIESVFDPFKGLEDILSRVIRAVGQPDERLKEDGLRSFRACRLASELNFQIDINTKNAIITNLNISRQISMERIRDELNKMITRSPKPSVGFRLMDETGLLSIIIPELITTKGITQPEWHSDDLFEHLLKCLDLAEDNIKLAALFHDIGKPQTKSEDENGIHFYSHDKVGSDITKNIMKRLRYSNHEIEKISTLVRWHMFYYPSADWRKDSDQTSNKAPFGWTDAAIRRFVNKVGEDNIEDLFKLRISDALANEKNNFDQSELDILEKRIAELRHKDMLLKVTDLEFNGEDLKKLGLKPGPLYTTILNDLLEQIIEEPNMNTKDNLYNYVQQKYIV